MSNRKEQIIRLLTKYPEGLTAMDVAEKMELDRTNVSRYLNELSKEKRVSRSTGRPIIFSALIESEETLESFAVTFDNLVGANESHTNFSVYLSILD